MIVILSFGRRNKTCHSVNPIVTPFLLDKTDISWAVHLKLIEISSLFYFQGLWVWKRLQIWRWGAVLHSRIWIPPACRSCSEVSTSWRRNSYSSTSWRRRTYLSIMKGSTYSLDKSYFLFWRSNIEGKRAVVLVPQTHSQFEEQKLENKYQNFLGSKKWISVPKKYLGCLNLVWICGSIPTKVVPFCKHCTLYGENCKFDMAEKAENTDSPWSTTGV